MGRAGGPERAARRPVARVDGDFWSIGCMSRMYEKRQGVHRHQALAVLLVCVLRLAQMQLLTSSEVQDEIAKLKVQRGQSKQFKTLRGKILDRRGRVLAADMPQFPSLHQLQLSCYLDDRVVRAKLAAAQRENANPSLEKIRDLVDDRRQDLEHVIDGMFPARGRPRAGRRRCSQALNRCLWNCRSFLCVVPRRPRSQPDRQVQDPQQCPVGEAMADLERQYPDPAERYRRIARMNDIPEVRKVLPLVELKTEDEVFDAQLEFRDMDDVQILPTGHRYYPYAATAAQTIGWVGPGDAAARREVVRRTIRWPAISRARSAAARTASSTSARAILRGRRGELVYDIDRQLVRETETEFGQDVQLTLDIELQKQIEQCLTDPQINPDYCHAAMAAAVIDVRHGRHPGSGCRCPPTI